jgi:hypothetical protein
MRGGKAPRRKGNRVEREVLALTAGGGPRGQARAPFG